MTDRLKILDMVVSVRCPVCDAPVDAAIRLFDPAKSNITVTVSPNVALFCVSRRTINEHMASHTDVEIETAARARAAVAEAAGDDDDESEPDPPGPMAW